MVNLYPVVTNVARIPVSPVDGGQVIGVLIAPSVNSYNVIGNNLQNITSVRWSPRNRASVQFRMIPFELYSNNMARFGIEILNNFNNAEDRGGYISFTRTDGTLIQWAVITYGNLGLTFKGPWSGLREFET